MKSKVNLVLVLTLCVLNGCINMQYIKPSGSIVTESHAVNSFDKVVVEGSFDVYISNGEQSFETKTYENIQEHIKYSVSNNELRIRLDRNVQLWGHHDIDVYISSDLINKVSISGSVDCDFHNYETDAMTIKASGSSEVEGRISAASIDIDASGSSDCSLSVNCTNLKTKASGSSDFEYEGYARTHNADLSGSSEIEAFDLESSHLKLTARGSFEGEVWVRESMDINLSGSSILRYKGHPQITQKVSGSSRIHNSN